MKRLLVALLLLSGSSSVFAQWLPQRLALGEGHVLQFAHPARMQVRIINNDGSQQLAFLIPDANNQVQMAFRITVVTDRENLLTNAEEEINFVRFLCEEAKPRALEVDVRIKRSADTPPVRYCSLTDARYPGGTQLPPGEFRHVTLSAKRAGPYVVTTEAVSNLLRGRDFNDFLAVFASMQVVAE